MIPENASGANIDPDEIFYNRGQQLTMLRALRVDSYTHINDALKKTWSVKGSTIQTVLKAIDDHANSQTGKPCYASQETLADELGFDRTTVTRSVEALREAGLIIVSRHHRNQTNHCKIDWSGINNLISSKLHTAASGKGAKILEAAGDSARSGRRQRSKRQETAQNVTLNDFLNGRNPESRARVRKPVPQSDKSGGRKPDQRCLDFAVQIAKAIPTTTNQDRQLIARAAILADTGLSERWLQEALGGVTQCPTLKPAAKFLTCCRDHAQRLHDADFDELFAATKVPKRFYKQFDAALASPAEPIVSIRAAPASTDMQARRRELAAQAAELEREST